MVRRAVVSATYCRLRLVWPAICILPRPTWYSFSLLVATSAQRSKSRKPHNALSNRWIELILPCTDGALFSKLVLKNCYIPPLFYKPLSIGISWYFMVFHFINTKSIKISDTVKWCEMRTLNDQSTQEFIKWRPTIIPDVEYTTSLLNIFHKRLEAYPNTL